MSEANVSFRSSLDRVIRLAGPTMLRVDGRGSISVYPQQHCYVSDIHDWAAVFSSPSDPVLVSPALWSVPPSDALPLTELHWRAAYYHVLCRLPSEAITRDLVQLVSWPNLSRLPQEFVAPVTRICALLWRKPTVGFLVPRVLETPTRQTCALLEVLRDFGHVTSPGGVPGRPEDARHEDGADLPAATPAQATHSLISKLWQRLVGH